MAIVKDTMYHPNGFHNSATTYNYGMLDPDVGAQIAGQQKVAEISTQPALQANQMKQDRFNSVFPWLQGQMGSFGSQMATAGGDSGQSPTIKVGGVWNPQQIQQQVNDTRAQNDRTTATKNAADASSLSGRGFGSNSPLLQALYGQNAAANLGTNTQAENQLRTQTAQQNAEHLLGTQTAKENQFASRQREDIERKKPIFSTYNSLIAALGGLV